MKRQADGSFIVMQCVHCGFLQDEPDGVKRCSNCGGALEYIYFSPHTSPSKLRGYHLADDNPGSVSPSPSVSLSPSVSPSPSEEYYDDYIGTSGSSTKGLIEKLKGTILGRPK